MPNHVHTILKFNDFKTFDTARKVLVDDKGHVNFDILIPPPISMYRGDLSDKDSKDFGGMTWYKWSVANWGTKWNAYNSEINVNELTISFDTAWDIPRPIIVAVANSIEGGSFTHYYLCEWTEWWGIEKWKDGSRLSFSRDDPEEFKEIFSMFRSWEETAKDYADDGEEWPPQYVLDSKPEKHTRMSFPGM